MTRTNTLNSPPIQPTVITAQTMHYTKDNNNDYNDHNNIAKHDPSSIPALLNKDQHDEQDFLPTPVTPANGFPLPLSSGDNNNATKKGSSSSVIFAISSAQSDGANKRLNNNSSNITTGNTDKNFTCRECDQTFTRPHNLKSHLATHSPERPFQVIFFHFLSSFYYNHTNNTNVIILFVFFSHTTNSVKYAIIISADNMT